MKDKKHITTEYEHGWQDAYKVIADYVEKEVCLVTAEMIRRMQTELWRYAKAGTKEEVKADDDEQANKTD